MAQKKYNIKTIKEIIEVVNENNLKFFKTDFCNWLDFIITFKKSRKELEKYPCIEKVETNLETFRWIDDGKTDVKININLV